MPVTPASMYCCIVGAVPVPSYASMKAMAKSPLTVPSPVLKSTFPAPMPALLLLSPELVEKLLIASVISTTSVPVSRPSMVPPPVPPEPFMSFTSAVIVTVGLASLEFSPICDIAASTVPNLPASLFAAVVVLISVGIVLIISTE